MRGMYRVCEKSLILEIMEARETCFFFEMTFHLNAVSFSTQVVRDKRAFVAAIIKYFILDRLPKDIVYIDEERKYNFKQGSNIKEAINDALDKFIEILKSDFEGGTLMDAAAKFYGEKEVRDFDKEINTDRDDEISDFAKAIDRMLNYKDKK